jgi:hypothetical protein
VLLRRKLSSVARLRRWREVLYYRCRNSVLLVSSYVSSKPRDVVFLRGLA